MTKIEKGILWAIAVCLILFIFSAAIAIKIIGDHGLKSITNCVWEGGEACENK